MHIYSYETKQNSHINKLKFLNHEQPAILTKCLATKWLLRCELCLALYGQCGHGNWGSLPHSNFR